MPRKPAKKARSLRPTHLRDWRLYKGLTLEQAAGRLDIDYTTLGRIERGLVPYNQGLLEQAAEAYGCQPGDLLNVNPLKEGQVVDLITVLQKATPEQRAEVIGFARGRISRTN